MTPKVSVIIPVYGTEAYLPACLESVLASTLQDIEVICVDDLSPDRCPQILDRYAKCDARVKVVHLTENGGQGIARNIGFAQARATYVYFLDSDDMITSDALESLFSRAESDSLDGVLFDSNPVFESEELAQRNASYLGMRQGTYPEDALPGLELLELFCRQREWTCYVQRQLWRRSFLEKHSLRFPEWASHEDEAFAFKAMLAAPRVAYVREPYFIRRYRDGSVMTTKPSLKNLKSYFMCCCEMEEFMAEHNIVNAWAEREVFRIYEACVRIYNQLISEGVNVDAGFAGTQMESRYLLFKTAQRSYLRYAMFSENLVERLRKAQRIYIYGAGVIAQRVHKALSMLSISVEAFVVTNETGNPKSLECHRVLALKDLPGPTQGSLALIALTDGYRAEVENALDERGWPHVYYRD